MNNSGIFGPGLQLSVRGLFTPDSLLWQAVWCGDIDQLRKLFTEGKASPNDEWGGSSTLLTVSHDSQYSCASPLIAHQLAVIVHQWDTCRFLKDFVSDPE